MILVNLVKNYLVFFCSFLFKGAYRAILFNQKKSEFSSYKQKSLEFGF